MKLSQALKQKNKLAVEIKKQYEIAVKFNSQEEGNPRRYSVAAALEKAEQLTKELVELKTKIHLANAPIYGKIFEMAELKGRVKQLKRVPTDEGKTLERFNSTPSVKDVEINVTQIDTMVAELESKIEKIQADLDYHNAITDLN